MSKIIEFPNSCENIYEGIIVEKTWTDGSGTEEVTIQEAVQSLEGGGYWKEGTVADMLMKGLELASLWAIFTVKK
jgi:hypothetical protein